MAILGISRIIPGHDNAPGPDDLIFHGMAALDRGDRGSAYRIFTEASELYPKYPEVWLWLGSTSPELDNAEAAFETAYDLDPDNEAASLGLRWVRLRRHSMDRELGDRIVGGPVPMPAPLAVPVPVPVPVPVTGSASAPAARQPEPAPSMSGEAIRPGYTSLTTAPLVPVEDSMEAAVSPTEAAPWLATPAQGQSRRFLGLAAAWLVGAFTMLVAVLIVQASFAPPSKNTVVTIVVTATPFAEAAGFEGAGLTPTESAPASGVIINSTPTSISISTSTPNPTNTPTEIPTATLVPTSTATPTNLPVPTDTPVPPPPPTFTPAPAPTVKRPAPTPVPYVRYVVRLGDNLSTIAARYGTTVVAIQRANGLRGTTIYKGQVLVIPVRR